MKRQDPSHTLPMLGERVFVETKEGSQLYARRQPDKFNPGDHLWYDDSGAVIRSPVIWWEALSSNVIAAGETP